MSNKLTIAEAFRRAGNRPLIIEYVWVTPCSRCHTESYTELDHEYSFRGDRTRWETVYLPDYSGALDDEDEVELVGHSGNLPIYRYYRENEAGPYEAELCPICERSLEILDNEDED